MYIKRVALSLVLVWSVLMAADACTTAVISGKYTKSGKPILWKLRDTERFYNEIKYFKGEKYKYMALVNSDKTVDTDVWGGYNETGFAIMNSASFNTNLDNPTDFKDQEGVIMKKALEECATLADFEKMLNSLPKPMGLNANFGVIDANGGAAYYETDNNGFIKFDANDPVVAPHGYIIRTNYSFTGKKDIGYGFIRFETASELFAEADAKGEINVPTILNDFSRSLKHSLMDVDYSLNIPANSKPACFVNTGDFITRHGSASNIVIEGVNNPKNADQTVMWTNLAFPMTSVSIPVWMNSKGHLPKVLKAEKDGKAPLAKYGMRLKKACYSVERSAGYKYMDLAAYANKSDGGIRKFIADTEKPVVLKADEMSAQWESKGKLDSKQLVDYYNWLDSYIVDEYEKYLKSQNR